jgi:hypothetical protein
VRGRPPGYIVPGQGRGGPPADTRDRGVDNGQWPPRWHHDRLDRRPGTNRRKGSGSAATRASHGGRDDCSRAWPTATTCVPGRRLLPFTVIDCPDTHVTEAARMRLRRCGTLSGDLAFAAGGQELLVGPGVGTHPFGQRVTASRRGGLLERTGQKRDLARDVPGPRPSRRPSRHRPVSTVEVDAGAASQSISAGTSSSDRATAGPYRSVPSQQFRRGDVLGVGDHLVPSPELIVATPTGIRTLAL